MAKHPVAFADIRIGGELARRAHRNFDRLERDPYRPGSVFQGRDQDLKWPGDREGRAVLGLALLEAATHRPARYLDEILHAFPARMNEKGYFGPALGPAICHEQQLSSHGWVLRGLCESSLHLGREDAAAMIEPILENLALPTAGHHARYPISPAERVHGGSFSGTNQQQIGPWVVSTDIGCDFIFLDGVSQAAVLLDRPGLTALVEEMIARFLQLDLLAIQAQTHATLTALRALLRWHEAGHGGGSLLPAVRERYDLYRSHAMTENYANYNWFGRPRWTEPCAMVDSLQVAMGLWKHLGEVRYVEDAHRIWHSGLNHGQRYNGGYGCDSCLGTGQTPFLRMETDESHWCCTMRGGEGLARAIQYGFFVEGDTVTLPMFLDADATLRLDHGTLRLAETTEYPLAGRVRLAVHHSDLEGPAELRLLAPSWSSGHRLTLNGQAVRAMPEEGFVALRHALRGGDVVEWSFEQPPMVRGCLNEAHLAGARLFEVGPLVLGHMGTDEIRLPADAQLQREQERLWRVQGTDVLLSPLDDMIDRPDAAKGSYSRQVLMRD